MKRLLYVLLPVVLLTCPALPVPAEEPALPPGLGGEGPSKTAPANEPALPAGLGGATAQAGEKTKTGPADWRDALPFQLMGFWEVRTGGRVRTDHYEDDTSIGETRLQLEGNKRFAGITATLVTDLIFDDVADHHTEVDLNEGNGFIDLRQANLAFTPVAFLDVKAGRQILTWGTGDLLFINDLFPKDWVSFFIGRDTEYLKAPSDAVKAALYTPAINVDVVYTPRFDADRYISGKRISYYNSGLDRRAGEDAVIRTDLPDDIAEDDEIALRVHRNIHGYELALYYYRGFWKSPAGQDMTTGRAIFPELEVTGASIRGLIAGGVANLEIGYKDSMDDRDGDDPLVQNSEWRLLAGYEKDLQQVARDFTVGIQYYLERMADYSDYKKTLPPGMPEKDENRHVFTLRLTKLLMQQNLTLSLFTYYSPSDQDGYLRPKAAYKLTDRWKIEAGGNIFTGDDRYTFFGQFEKNSNVYAMARYSF